MHVRCVLGYTLLNDIKNKICKKNVLNFTVYDDVESENESKKGKSTESVGNYRIEF